jgi:prepilin signal peptidase PulO-like enzyme (type II secretory pathway)
MASFGQLVATRLPNNESIQGRSYCPNCRAQLRIIDIIPLLGYLFNKGRCHICNEKISGFYLLVEALGGLLYTGAFLFIGFQWELIVSFVMITVLLIESISDIQKMIVIDKVWMVGLGIVFLIRSFQGTVTEHITAALIMFIFLFGLAYLGKRIAKREVFGGGDIKLYLFIGFCLTLVQSFLSLFLASFFGFAFAILTKRRLNSTIAMVPFIFLGVLVSYFFGTQMIEWYLSLLGM